MKVFSYPTSIITAVWSKDTSEGRPVDESITFNTSEGTSISGDVSLSFSLNSDSVPNFYVKFRNDDIQEFLHGYLHNVARDALNEIASKYALEDLYGSKKEEFLSAVKVRINNDIGRYGSISQFGFTGALRMDPRIVEALNNKLKAVQNAITAENELRQTEANARKLVAQKAGEAEANNKLAQSISPNLLEWKRLEISEICAQKWDGKQPEFLSGGGNSLMLQLPVPK
jgi:regulator of protease activity HflC (stomatin/prohibitin superfamily)